MLTLAFVAATVGLSAPAWAGAPPAETVGVVATRSPGKRPTPKDLAKLSKALHKEMARSLGWDVAVDKDAAAELAVGKAAETWRCRAEPIEALADPVDAGRELPEVERRCVVELARRAGFARVVLVHLRFLDDAYHLDLHHVRGDSGRVVNHVVQRVPGKAFDTVLRFAPALSRRIAEELGGFRLVGNVEGADVEMDGMFLGKTPLAQTDMAPGAYRLKITADGYFDWKGEARVKPGMETVVDVQMEQPRVSAPPPPPTEDVALKWSLVGGGAAVAVGGLAWLALSGDTAAMVGGLGLTAVGAAACGYGLVYEF